MATWIFYFGGLLLISALFVFRMKHGICLGIVKQTQGTKEALTHEELFWNSLQSQKRSKLHALASRQSDPALQADTQRVLQLEVIYYSLLGAGMLLLALGAASMSAT